MLPPNVLPQIGASLLIDRGKSAITTLTQSEKSLLDFARIGQINPLVVIDSDIRHNPLMKDILHVLCTLYAATYMQALAYEDLLGDVKIADRIDKFNPNAGPGLAKSVSSQFGLNGVGQEAYNDSKKDAAGTGDRVELFTKENTSEITEDRSLAVGKMLTLKLHDRTGNPRPIPITIRMIPATIGTGALLDAFSLGSRWNSTSERRHRINEGELHWLWDGWFKLDLIEAHRRALINDESGVYAALSKRRSSRLIDNIVKGKQSLVTASAITVMSARTAKELERRLGGKLSNEKIRNGLFEETGMMIIVVYDPSFEQLTFYYRGASDAASFTANEIKSNSKKKDVDMLEIINTLMNKGAPTF